jgi:hypothetical protein
MGKMKQIAIDLYRFDELVWKYGLASELVTAEQKRLCALGFSDEVYGIIHTFEVKCFNCSEAD